MKRYEDWEVRAVKQFEEWNTVPFDWGLNNCCMRVADVVLAMTGEDLAEDMRAAVGDHEAALRIMSKRGWKSVEDVADEYLDRYRNPRDAKRGDVVMIEGPNGDALGIRWGKFVIAPADEATVSGNRFLPVWQEDEDGQRVYAIKAAWRVGE